MLGLRLADLREAEQRAEMPLLVMSPTTINDGRRLLIASSPVGFLTDTRTGPFVTVHPSPESVELARFFRDRDADSLRLTSGSWCSSCATSRRCWTSAR